MRLSTILAGVLCAAGISAIFAGNPAEAIAQVWTPISAVSALSPVISQPASDKAAANQPDNAASVETTTAGSLQQDAAGVPAAKPSDVSSIDAIMAAVYDVISGPAGQKRDWDRMRSLFVPGAHLIAVGHSKDGGFALRMVDVDGYAKGAQPYFDKDGFFEKESARRTQTYGQIAEIFSTYESRHKPDDARPFERGINSFQLMNDGKRWWVVNIFWEGESDAGPIPKKYQTGRQ